MSPAPSLPDDGDAGENEASHHDDGADIERRLQAGQLVTCRVMEREPGGYAVYLDVDNLPGFLPTDLQLKVGSELKTQFVCFHQGRALVSTRNIEGGLTNRPKYRTPSVQWAESNPKDEKVPVPITGGEARTEGDNEAMLRTIDRVRKTFTRATDLMVPPFDGYLRDAVQVSEGEVDALIAEWETSMRTCCIKSACENRKSRSAVLMYQGVVLGAVYRSADKPETSKTREALRLIIDDWKQGEHEMSVFDLPESVVLAQSALFIGTPVERTDNLDARGYVQYILTWMEIKEQTGCIALLSQRTNECLLVYMHNGKFAGAFLPDEQQYFDDFLVVDVFTKNEPRSEVDVSVLPEEIVPEVTRYGYFLSAFNK